MSGVHASVLHACPSLPDTGDVQKKTLHSFWIYKGPAWRGLCTARNPLLPPPCIWQWTLPQDSVVFTFGEMLHAELTSLSHLLCRDYYDYKTQAAEGFSKRKLFEIMDGLEVQYAKLYSYALIKLITLFIDMAHTISVSCLDSQQRSPTS